MASNTFFFTKHKVSGINPVVLVCSCCHRLDENINKTIKQKKKIGLATDGLL